MSSAVSAKPRLSVAVITYNHARFIERALQSAVDQKIDFPLQIVIGDDASSDGAQDIIREFAQGHAHKARFTLLLNERNQGNFSNVTAILAACEGEYVAVLEGDDYWTFEGKLLAQVDWLDAHPEHSGSFHDAEIRNDAQTEARRGDVVKTGYRFYSQIHRYTPELEPWQMIERVLPPSSALVYRNGSYLNELSAYADVKVSLGEILKLLVAKGGPFAYINENWAVHNNHAGGVTKTRPKGDFIEAHLRIFRALLKDDFYRRYRAHIHDSMAEAYIDRYWSAAGRADGRNLNSVLRVFLHGLLSVIYRSWDMARWLRGGAAR